MSSIKLHYVSVLLCEIAPCTRWVIRDMCNNKKYLVNHLIIYRKNAAAHQNDMSSWNVQVWSHWLFRPEIIITNSSWT